MVDDSVKQLQQIDKKIRPGHLSQDALADMAAQGLSAPSIKDRLADTAAGIQMLVSFLKTQTEKVAATESADESREWQPADKDQECRHTPATGMGCKYGDHCPDTRCTRCAGTGLLPDFRTRCPDCAGTGKSREDEKP